MGISVYLEPVYRVWRMWASAHIYSYHTWSVIPSWAHAHTIHLYTQILLHVESYFFLDQCPYHPSIDIQPIALGVSNHLGLMPSPSIYMHSPSVYMPSPSIYTQSPSIYKLRSNRIWGRNFFYIDPIALGELFLLGLMPTPSIYTHKAIRCLRLVGSIELQVSFAIEPYKRNSVLQKRPIISRSLLVVATPYRVRYD